MTDSGTPASDLVYDLVAIQYHALKGGHNNDKYLQDAGSDQEAKEFIQQVQKEDAWRAKRAHQLLARLTKDQIDVSDTSPSGATTNA